MLNDAHYNAIRENIDKLTIAYDAFHLPDEQRKVVNEMFDAYNQLGAYLGEEAYELGFHDCADFLKHLYFHKKSEPFSNG